MKLQSIFVISTLILIVRGAWWAAAVQPLVLGFGAILTALNQDVLDVESIELKGWLPFVNKLEESKDEEEEIEYIDEGSTISDEPTIAE